MFIAAEKTGRQELLEKIRYFCNESRHHKDLLHLAKNHIKTKERMIDRREIKIKELEAQVKYYKAMAEDFYKKIIAKSGAE